MLEQLTHDEEVLLAQVERVAGSMEAKAAELRQLGVFASYSTIHARYAALAIATDVADGVRTEALKRAVFLQWYTSTEPPCFSGIDSTNKAAATTVISRLNALAADDAFDDELRSMLAFYFTVAGFYFESFSGAGSLLNWFAHQPAQGEIPRLPVATMLGRGQLGRYWTSMLA